MSQITKIVFISGGILLSVLLMVFIVKTLEDSKLSEVPKDWIEKKCEDFTFKIPPHLIDKSWNSSNFTFTSSDEYFEVTIDYQEDFTNCTSIRGYVALRPDLIEYIAEDDKFNYSEDCKLLSYNFSTIGGIEAIKMIESFLSDKGKEILMESYLISQNGYLARIRFLYSDNHKRLKERIYRTFIFIKE